MNLSNQTELYAVNLVNVEGTVLLPTQPKNLCFVVLSENYAQDEEFLKSLLPDRTGDTPGQIYLAGITPFDFITERNWEVLG